MATTADSCVICRENKAIYKCPACATRTCSLDCSKKHKVQMSCAGTVDATRYVNRRELKGSATTINRDYGFLQSIDRAVVLGKRSATDVLGSGPRNKRHPGQLVRNEVHIRTVPVGMHRSKINRSGWNNRRKKYLWTVEWVYIGDDGETERTLTSECVDSDTVDALVVRVLGLPTNPGAYLTQIDCPANKPRLIALDGSQTLAAVLKGKWVLEFPTIVVCSKVPSKYNVDSDSESESESESDSDSSSDDSNDSDSDSAPEEESSRPQTAEASSTGIQSEESSFIPQSSEVEPQTNEAESTTEPAVEIPSEEVRVLSTPAELTVPTDPESTDSKPTDSEPPPM